MQVAVAQGQDVDLAGELVLVEALRAAARAAAAAAPVPDLHDVSGPRP